MLIIIIKNISLHGVKEKAIETHYILIHSITAIFSDSLIQITRYNNN